MIIVEQKQRNQDFLKRKKEMLQSQKLSLKRKKRKEKISIKKYHIFKLK